MSKNVWRLPELSAWLCSGVLLVTVVAVNPWPLQNGTQTISFAFPKYIALGLSLLAAFFVNMISRNPGQGGVKKNGISWLDALASIFFCCAIMSAVVRSNPLDFVQEWLAVWLPFVAMVWLASQAAEDHTANEVLVNVIRLAGILVALSAIYDAAGGPLPWILPKRPNGLLGNRSDVAAFCVAVIPFVFFGLLDQNSRFRDSLCLLLLIIAIVISRSRAAWLVSGIVFLLLPLVLLLFVGRDRCLRNRFIGSLVLFYTVSLGGILVAVFFPWPRLHWVDVSPYSSTLHRLLEFDRGTGMARLQQYKLACAMLVDGFWFGSGPGAWRRDVVRYIDRIPEIPGSLVDHTQVPNSEFIKIATETGLIGLVLFVAMGLILLVTTWRVMRRRGICPELPVGVSLVAYGLMSFFDSMTARPESLALIGILVGLIRARCPRVAYSSSRIRRTAEKTFSGARSAVFLSGFVLVIACGWGNFIFLTNDSPVALASVPDYLPMPAYSMQLLKQTRKVQDPDCQIVRDVFERAIELYPFERGLRENRDRICGSTGFQIGKEHATWARSLFFRGYEPTKGEPLTTADIELFVTTLAGSGVKYAYMFSGPFQGDGSLPDYAFSQTARNSIMRIKSIHPGIKILPWVGGIQNRTVKLGDRQWMLRAVEDTLRLVDTLPVDGIHLDFEYLLPGDGYLSPGKSMESNYPEMQLYDQGMIEFHAMLRSARPDLFVSSVVVSTASQTRPWKKKHDLDQIIQLARNVNQLSFLYYDTQIDDPVLYEEGMREQLLHMKKIRTNLAEAAPQLLIAIGTFVNEPELRHYRDMSLENLPYTLDLLKRLVTEVSPYFRIVDGLAIYCEWQTSAEEWRLISASVSGNSMPKSM